MLEPVVKEYQKKLNLEKNREIQITPKSDTTKKPRKPMGKKSIISILEDLE